MRRRPSVPARAVTAGALALVAGVVPLLGSAAPATAEPATPAAHAGAPRHPSSLTWVPCEGLDAATAAAGVTCASVPVPLDYRRPKGRWITVVIARRPASDPKHRRGVLLTTGGGPGGPGVPQVGVLANRLPAAVTKVYDIVGVDQRFVERSTPISCGQAQEEPGAFWVRAPAIPFDDVVAQARGYAEDCAANAGWALPHATTANAARDLDRVRAALGVPKVTVVASSYAAYVGAIYARMFPQHLDRAVLDSPIDPAKAWRPFELAHGATFQAALDSFCAWTADRDAEYGLGTTGADVCARWWALAGRLDSEPLAFWTTGLLGSITFSSLYDEHTWPQLATIVSTLDRGEVATPPPFPAEVRAPGTPVDNHTAVSTAYRCGESLWPTDLDQYRADVADYGSRFPFVGGHVANVTPCAFWPVNRDVRVQLDGARARGVLVVGATGDPATPYEGSVAVRNAFPHSRLVTLDATVHAPLQAFADPCVDAAVAAHLLARKPQAGKVRCGTPSGGALRR